MEVFPRCGIFELSVELLLKYHMSRLKNENMKTWLNLRAHSLLINIYP